MEKELTVSDEKNEISMRAIRGIFLCGLRALCGESSLPDFEKAFTVEATKKD